jgi:hypothetical protein
MFLAPNPAQPPVSSPSRQLRDELSSAGKPAVPGRRAPSQAQAPVRSPAHPPLLPNASLADYPEWLASLVDYICPPLYENYSEGVVFNNLYLFVRLYATLGFTQDGPMSLHAYRTRKLGRQLPDARRGFPLERLPALVFVFAAVDAWRRFGTSEGEQTKAFKLAHEAREKSHDDESMQRYQGNQVFVRALLHGLFENENCGSIVEKMTPFHVDEEEFQEECENWLELAKRDGWILNDDGFKKYWDFLIVELTDRETSAGEGEDIEAGGLQVRKVEEDVDMVLGEERRGGGEMLTFATDWLSNDRKRNQKAWEVKIRKLIHEQLGSDHDQEED